MRHPPRRGVGENFGERRWKKVATEGEPFSRQDVFLTSRAGDRRRVGL